MDRIRNVNKQFGRIGLSGVGTPKRPDCNSTLMNEVNNLKKQNSLLRELIEEQRKDLYNPKPVARPRNQGYIVPLQNDQSDYEKGWNLEEDDDYNQEPQYMQIAPVMRSEPTTDVSVEREKKTLYDKPLESTLGGKRRRSKNRKNNRKNKRKTSRKN